VSKLRLRRPTPSLVISILALIVALGGSAYAASKVGTKNIKRNAVTASKIKKGAVTTVKLKNNAVTGAKVNEGTLGPVPNALHADNATTAANAVNATNFSRFGTTGVITKSFDNENLQPLASGPGPFFFETLCLDSDNDQAADTAYATISSSVAGAFVYSPGISDASGGLQKANIPVSISPSVVSDKSWGKEMSEFTASTPDGSLVLRGFVEVGTQVFGGECAYNISWLVVS
jgi:hypothetical protein